MNRPPEVPEAYIFYKGDWCHPSRVPKDLRSAAQVLTMCETTSHDAAAICDNHKEAANMRVAKAHPPKRIRQSAKPLMNKLEQEYFERLKRIYAIIIPQSMRFMLGNGIWYKPDFIAWPLGAGSSGMIAFEVKGEHAFRGGFENLKVAANKYQNIMWVLVWKENNQWLQQTILP